MIFSKLIKMNYLHAGLIFARKSIVNQDLILKSIARYRDNTTCDVRDTARRL